MPPNAKRQGSTFRARRQWNCSRRTTMDSTHHHGGEPTAETRKATNPTSRSMSEAYSTRTTSGETTWMALLAAGTVMPSVAVSQCFAAFAAKACMMSIMI